jgi:hypothetical protein
MFSYVQRAMRGRDILPLLSARIEQSAESREQEAENREQRAAES